MSQRIEDIIDEASSKQKKEIADAKSDLSKVIDKAESDITNNSNAYQDTVDRVRRSNEEPKKSIDSSTAQGYNPTMQNQVDNSSQGGTHSPLNKNDGLENPNNLNNDREQLGDHSKEAAPDIGKDYGSSQEPGYNGYNPYNTTPEGSHEERPDGINNGVQDESKQVEKRAPEEAGQGDAAQAGQDGVDSTSKKPNELDQIDREKAESGKKNDADDSKKKTPEPEAPAGNGYGAINKRPGHPNPTNGVSDGTKNARKNLNHSNKVKDGNNQTKGTKKKPTTPSKNPAAKKTPSLGKKGPGVLGGMGSKAKQGFKKFFNRKSQNEISDGDGSGKTHDNSFVGDMLNAAVSSLLSNPFVLICLGVIIVFIIALLSTMDDDMGGFGKGRGGKTCTYNLSGVTATGSIELSNLKVEVINCDGTESDYTVLETVDFEKYVLGVALAEAGPSSPDEAIKAQIIAVRNFTLTRNRGMCPSNPDNCFFGYNASTGIIRMRACTNDQVYWDYTKDCPAQDRSGKPTLYCVGVDSPTKTWKKALSAERQAEVEAIAQEVIGEVLLDETGNVLKVGYQKDETDKFIEMANGGSTYVEILDTVYGSSQYSSASCKYGNFDYGDYQLTSDGNTILHEPLEDFLKKNGTSLEEFNELIASNVEDAGYGTRAGVVAAAVTLIAELGNNYGVKVPYYWGGGHYDGVVVGALGYWGSTQCHTTANGQSYDYCGLDCSGFVPWAIKNGGFNKGVGLASDFQYMPGANKVKLSNSPVMQPGDLLESDGHVILIVGIDEAAGQYICAEAMGNAYGVLFTRRSFTESGYWGVDLEDYYNNPSNVRSS